MNWWIFNAMAYHADATKHMKGNPMPLRLIAALFALAFVAPAYGAERTFLIGGFEELIVEGEIQVTLDTGKAASAKATGDKRDLSALKIDRQGKIARIRLEGPQIARKSGEPLRVALTGRDIRKLVLRGNGSISATDLVIADMRVEMQGSGQIDIANLKTDQLSVVLFGNGKLSIANGAVTTGKIIIDGSANIDAVGLKVNELKLIQSGPADVRFTVERIADITNSGTGSIVIDGSATCLIRRAGGANIQCESAGKSAGK
jgi:Putative auto-transporter adhesin, head GIN domain